VAMPRAVAPVTLARAAAGYPARCTHLGFIWGTANRTGCGEVHQFVVSWPSDARVVGLGASVVYLVWGAGLSGCTVDGAGW
jgi:hypothetical protein